MRHADACAGCDADAGAFRERRSFGDANAGTGDAVSSAVANHISEEVNPTICLPRGGGNRISKELSENDSSF